MTVGAGHRGGRGDGFSTRRPGAADSRAVWPVAPGQPARARPTGLDDYWRPLRRGVVREKGVGLVLSIGSQLAYGVRFTPALPKSTSRTGLPDASVPSTVT